MQNLTSHASVRFRGLGCERQAQLNYWVVDPHEAKITTTKTGSDLALYPGLKYLQVKHYSIHSLNPGP